MPAESPTERIAAPHLKHDYNTVCNIKLEPSQHKSLTSKFTQMFTWLFSPKNDDTQSQKVDL